MPKNLAEKYSVVSVDRDDEEVYRSSRHQFVSVAAL